jgi:hypothetical protein
MNERWVKFTSRDHGTDQWVNMAHVHLLSRSATHGTKLTFSNDSLAGISFIYAVEPVEHFLPSHPSSPIIDASF